MCIPEKIYKYYPFSEYSLKSLKSQTLYFASPLKFNDPYDCAITAKFEQISDSDATKFKDKCMSDDRVTEAEKRFLRSASLDELKIEFLKVLTDHLNKYIAEFQKKRGICCFTENNDNLLMWSHYANVSKGFCLEFNPKLAPQLSNKLRKVTYSEKLPTINCSNLDGDESSKEILKLFCTKSLDWIYEKEWRAIHSDVNTVYCYPPESLTGVYFGPNMDREHMEIICLVLQGQNPNVKFHRGERSQDEFKVIFNEFSYEPYIKSSQK